MSPCLACSHCNGSAILRGYYVHRLLFHAEENRKEHRTSSVSVQGSASVWRPGRNTASKCSLRRHSYRIHSNNLNETQFASLAAGPLTGTEHIISALSSFVPTPYPWKAVEAFGIGCLQWILSIASLGIPFLRAANKRLASIVCFFFDKDAILL